VARNVSSVARNVSWRRPLVARNMSSRPALFASPRADDVALLHIITVERNRYAAVVLAPMSAL
jgi:hypothetical protein